MSKKISHEKLEALAGEITKDLKSERDLSVVSRELLKRTAKAALNAEHGGEKLFTPRYRKGSFDPPVAQDIPDAADRARRSNPVFLWLWMSTSEIAAAFRDFNGMEVSSGLVSQMMDSIRRVYPKFRIQLCVIRRRNPVQEDMISGTQSPAPCQLGKSQGWGRGSSQDLPIHLRQQSGPENGGLTNIGTSYLPSTIRQMLPRTLTERFQRIGVVR